MCAVYIRVYLDLYIQIQIEMYAMYVYIYICMSIFIYRYIWHIHVIYCYLRLGSDVSSQVAFNGADSLRQPDSSAAPGPQVWMFIRQKASHKTQNDDPLVIHSYL